MSIRCPACNRTQKDRGKGRSCTNCGTSPLPSYKYRRVSTFHPSNCNCEVGKPTKLERKTAKAKMPNLGTEVTITNRGL